MIALDICCKTDVGKKRTVNEDSPLVKQMGDLYLLAVADGLGGHSAGEVASRVALVEIEEYLKTNLREDNIQEAMERAIAKANKEVFLLSKENSAYAGMCTTLVAALVSDNKVLIANVGDSRAYLIGDNIWHTTDHSLVQELVTRRVIAEEEAFDHPQKNIVTRTLGAETEVSADFYNEELSGKTLLLCSDGLTDMLRDREIRETIAVLANLDEACTRLIDLANERGGKDNITVILARAKS